MNNIFETAARNKVRFETSKGLLSIEDLFDLPLTSQKGPSLDEVAKGIYRQLKESDEISFVDANTASNNALNMKFDLVKRVIEIKKDEAAVALQARDRRARNARIMELMEQKKDEQLAGKSLEELQALLDAS